jgi:multidrug resistance efflux pump
VQDGAVTRQEFEQKQTTLQAAQATLESRKAAVNAAQRQVTASQGNLTQTRTTGLNPEINQAQIGRFNTQLKQAQADLKAAQAEVANAEADRNRIQSQLKDLTVTSPIDGVVTSRSVEPGVVVTSGKTLLSLLDLNTVYMRGFIPEGDIGQVRVGQTAQVYLDSNPKQPLTARVSAIDSKASFTPENIYFQKAIHRARAKSKNITPEYTVILFWFYAKFGGLKDFVTTSTISHLTGEKLKTIPIPVPPISLQKKFDDLISNLKDQKNISPAQNNLTDTLFQTLLQKAFKGELEKE